MYSRNFFRSLAQYFRQAHPDAHQNRLWDFPRKNFVLDWYLAAVAEHGLIVDAIETRSREKLMHAIKELHWDFHYNERHIRKVYNLE